MSPAAGEPQVRPGPTNSLVDVAGLRVGHRTASGAGWLTGTTVVLAPRSGAVGGVDVRGGGPGTRETDLLDPRNVVERVHAVALCGSSAFGLGAADGVMARLAAAGTGLRVGAGDVVVPIVPAAVVVDLGRGGDATARADASFGADAHDAASDGFVVQGCVGAGAGALAGRFKGGIGSASAVLPGGAVVAALVVVNALGSPSDPRTGELWGARHLLPGEAPGLRRPDPREVAALGDPDASQRRGDLHTTIGVVATDLALTKAQCAKLAGVGHDGLARAVRPVHTMFDGDTLFGLSTVGRPAPDPQALHGLLTVAADCVTRAVVHAVLAATTTRTPAGEWASYADALPSALAAPPPHP